MDVRDTEVTLAHEYSHDVEAQGIEGGMPVGQVLFGEGTQGGLFTEGDGLERVSETRSAAQFDLDEDEDAVAADDQIDLAVAGPIIAFDEFVATPGQVAQREVFAPLAGGLLSQAPTPA